MLGNVLGRVVKTELVIMEPKLAKRLVIRYFVYTKENLRKTAVYENTILGR